MKNDAEGGIIEYNQGVRVKEKKFFRDCPSCSKQIGHVSAKTRNRAVKANTLCGSCAAKGKPKSAQHAANISASKTGKTRKPFSDETKAKMSAAKKGKPCTNLAYNQTLRDAYTKLYGDKYNFPNHHFTEWAYKVKERDSYTCQKCNTVASGSLINAHHVVPKAYFMARAVDIDNGVTLCRSCHMQVHRELDKYTLKGVKFSATDFQNHLKGFINGPIKE